MIFWPMIFWYSVIYVKRHYLVFFIITEQVDFVKGRVVFLHSIKILVAEFGNISMCYVFFLHILFLTQLIPIKIRWKLIKMTTFRKYAVNHEFVRHPWSKIVKLDFIFFYCIMVFFFIFLFFYFFIFLFYFILFYFIFLFFYFYFIYWWIFL